jgi:hypothetical protein
MCTDLDISVSTNSLLNHRYSNQDNLAKGLEASVPGGWPFGFESLQVAEQFRHAAFERAGVAAPPLFSPDGTNLPKVITFMTAVHGEDIVNEVTFFSSAFWHRAGTQGGSLRCMACFGCPCPHGGVHDPAMETVATVVSGYIFFQDVACVHCSAQMFHGTQGSLPMLTGCQALCSSMTVSGSLMTNCVNLRKNIQ